MQTVPIRTLLQEEIGGKVLFAFYSPDLHNIFMVYDM